MHILQSLKLDYNWVGRNFAKVIKENKKNFIFILSVKTEMSYFYFFFS